MNQPSPSLAIRLLARVSGAAAVLVALAGLVDLIVWRLGTAPLVESTTQLSLPLPTTALGITAIGISLWLGRSDDVPRWSIIASRIVAAFAVAWAVVFLVEWIATIDLGADKLLFADRLRPAAGRPPGRPSVSVAVTLVLLGSALIALHADSPIAHMTTRVGTALALLITFTILVSHVNGARDYYHVYPVGDMALVSALTLGFAALGVLLVRPAARGGLSSILIDEAAGGVLARRLLPVAILVPMVLGRLWLSGAVAGWYDPKGGASLFVVASTVVLVWAVARSAHVVHATDVQRSRLLVREQMAREEAERANQAKGNFLAVMSHELRTPLSAIIGYEELLADEITGPINDGQRQQLSRIKASARHLLQLIDEILTYSRVEVGREAVDIETVPLQAVIDDAVALVAPMADDKGVALTCSKLDGVTPIRTDAQKVRQIVVNLLSNAVKFTAAGGSISVTLTTTERRVTITIRDSGIGIAGEFLDRIFEPFWQVEQKATRTAGGTGLGLSVSRRLARMLGGEIEVESTVGEGSTFIVTLPLDALNLAQSHPRVPTPTAPRPSLSDAQVSPRRAPASVESSASART